MNIGEAANSLGVSAKMIRYDEATGLIPEASRTASGYRTYADREVQMLRFIRRARGLGFSVERITELLALWRGRSRHSADVERVALEQIAGLRRRIREMEGMVQALDHLAEGCSGDHRPDCPILADLEGESSAVPATAHPGRSFGTA
ncbi:MAG: Cu(I)-responsive transcriptional regulator [Phaeovulum sp.]|uniref:Cu(I)-responsive transcriptional regulator n=1 Tax=Phaeovulum sp. TaxID=2934796 RepID=UPI002736D54D|nr:Cu(I)-responsive transcriptional regulator [Phaeovulum sp.]MDP3860722.1 Cu(I)-responsive transcriptional regulator [Phaeovulum sp.]